MAQEGVVYVGLSCLNLPSECAEGVRVAVGALMEDGNGFVEIGQTETIIGHVNPSFERTVPIVVRLDLNQHLKFTLYRVVDEVIQEACGDVELNLLTLLTNPGQVALPITISSGSALFHRHSQQAIPMFVANASLSPDGGGRGTVLRFVGEALSAEYGFQTAPYFTMELLPASKEKMPILLYRSEVAHNCENPKWREFTIPTSFFPSTSDWSLQVSCYNFNNNAEDFLLGRFSTTFYQLLNNKHGTNKFMLRKGGKKRRDSSMELVSVRSRDDAPAFLNSLKSGIQMHFTVAIDFTANNGGPNSLDSLHFIHPHNSNAYMNVLGEISPALTKFDKLDRLSMLGFGAKVPPKFELSQLFALNGDLNNPHVKSASEIIHYYKNSAITLLPYAPTEYSSVIHHVIKLAKASLRATAGFYFTLIILTNGAIRDVRDTVDTIVQASELPISIVFVAVGNSAHPVGLSGNVANLTQLLSPTLKSSKNAPLRRETASLVVLNNQGGHNPPSSLLSETTLSFVTQRIFSNLPRQATLWTLHNRGQ